MKNVIIGMTGALVILLVCALSFSIYGTTSRANELSHGLSYVVRNTLEKHLGSQANEEEVCREIEEKLRDWVSSSSQIDVQLKVCDFEEGILSVCVKETYQTPFGIKREKTYEKTAIVE